MRTREEHALAARTGAGQHQSDEHEAGQTLCGGHFLYCNMASGMSGCVLWRRRERRPLEVVPFQVGRMYMEYVLTHTADMNER